VIGGTALVVVGVVLNLAVWLGLHTLFGMVTEIMELGMVIPMPHLTTLDVFAFLLAAVMFLDMWRLRWGIIPVVLVTAICTQEMAFYINFNPVKLREEQQDPVV